MKHWIKRREAEQELADVRSHCARIINELRNSRWFWIHKCELLASTVTAQANDLQEIFDSVARTDAIENELTSTLAEKYNQEIEKLQQENRDLRAALVRAAASQTEGAEEL